MQVQTVLLWSGFIVFILGMLTLDLKVLQRDHHEMQLREALLWTLFWIALALLFNAGVLLFRGSEKALEFLTGYLIEESLSVDNLFVFVLVLPISRFFRSTSTRCSSGESSARSP